MRRSTSSAIALAARRTSGKTHVALDRGQDVQTGRARRLRVRPQPELVQHLAHDERDLADERPLPVGRRVEIDQQVVGLLDLGHARVPGVQLDAAEVGDPGEAGRVVEHREDGRVPARELHEDLVDVVRMVLRHALLVEELACDAVGEPLHVERPTPDVGESERRDVDVVRDEVELRQPALREEHLLRAGHRNVASADPHRASIVNRCSKGSR